MELVRVRSQRSEAREVRSQRSEIGGQGVRRDKSARLSFEDAVVSNQNLHFLHPPSCLAGSEF